MGGEKRVKLLPRPVVLKKGWFPLLDSFFCFDVYDEQTQSPRGALWKRCSSKFRISQASLFTQACNFIKKESLAQVFSREFCEISKDTFSYRTPLVAASRWTY